MGDYKQAIQENMERTKDLIRKIKDLRREFYYYDVDAFNTKQYELNDRMIDLTYDLEDTCNEFLKSEEA